MIKPPPDFRKDTAPYRVFFNWEITHKCNYKCSYCFFGNAVITKEPTDTVYSGKAKCIAIWQDIYKRYGSCEIHFAGGEPFIYPEFMDLIEQLSEIHTMEFSTNFFWDPDDFIKRIKPGRARIGVSFHPEFIDFDTFFSKALKIKKAGFELWVNYVAYPSFLEGIDRYKDVFAQYDIPMYFLPFKGRYNRKEYPDNYTQEEKGYLKKLGANIVSEKTLDFAFTKDKKNDENKLCRMGQMYAKIWPNGQVFRCCLSTTLSLGNIFDGTFALLEHPLSCREDNCPCWKRMLIGNEEYWLEHWPVPPDAKYK